MNIFVRVFFSLLKIISLQSMPRSDIANIKDMYMSKTSVKISPRKEVPIYNLCSSKTFTMSFNEYSMLLLERFFPLSVFFCISTIYSTSTQNNMKNFFISLFPL